jgi:riboflavin synthase
MFTGLITGVGTVRDVTPIDDGKDARFVIAVPHEGSWAEISSVPLGASIACSGCCLTVIDRTEDSFTVEVSAESLNLTTLGAWRTGSKINLETSLRLGDEMGGHIVSGHVDGLADIVSITPENGSSRWRFMVPASLGRLIAPKGSVAVNGVSLTVNEVIDHDSSTEFGVNIIPHTAAHTNFAVLAAGDKVNIEIDMLARYVARLRDTLHV